MLVSRFKTIHDPNEDPAASCAILKSRAKWCAVLVRLFFIRGANMLRSSYLRWSEIEVRLLFFPRCGLWPGLLGFDKPSGESPLRSFLFLSTFIFRRVSRWFYVEFTERVHIAFICYYSWKFTRASPA